MFTYSCILVVGRVGGISLLLVGYNLLDVSVAIGVQQALKLLDLLAKLMAYVGVGNTHTVGRHLDNLRCRLDVAALLDSVQGRRERLVLHQYKSTAVIDKGVAGNTSLLMVCLRETAVDNHKLAVGLNWILAVAYMYRHMAVDDVAIGACNLEGIHYVVYNLLVVAA